MGRGVAERQPRGGLPAGKLYPIQERRMLGFEPLGGYRGGRKRRGPAGEHEARSRRGLQHFGNCREQLPYALPLDQPSAIKHRRHFRTGRNRRRQGGVRIFNPVPYDPYFIRGLRIVLLQENFLRSRQGDQSVGSVDSFLLGSSLRKERIGFIADVIFGPVDGVHVKYERLSGRRFDAARYIPKHRSMEMNDIGTPFLNRTHASSDRL